MAVEVTPKATRWASAEEIAAAEQAWPRDVPDEQHITSIMQATGLSAATARLALALGRGASDACGIVPDFKSEPGFLVVKAFMRETVSPMCSVYIGEALYQLRSTLDHLVCHLTESNGQAVTTKTGFPIFLQDVEFRDATG